MDPSTPDATRLLAFARELQRAATFDELLDVTRAETSRVLGYPHAWLFIMENEGDDTVRMLQFSGEQHGRAWEVAPVLPVRGDAMIEEIFASDAPVVVEDARTDPRTNKAIVEQLGNRTIVNVPLRLLDKPLGALGTGTFGDEEGCRPPTAAQLAYLVGMAAQVSVAAGRIRFLEERRQAHVALERAARARDDFLTSASHELKTPLTALSLQLESARHILAEAGGPTVPVPPLEKKLASVSRHVERLTSLINGLLEVTRVASGALELTRETIDLRAPVKAAIASAEDAAARAGGAIRLEAPSAVVGFWDRKAIESVAYALLSNAIKYGAGKPIAVRISGVGRRARLVVEDHGIGIDASEHDRIFRRFERAVAPSQPTGFGLGLWVTRHVVEAHGGTISVVSAPGEGATFTVDLPTTDDG